MRRSVPDDIDPFVRKSELARFITPDLSNLEKKLMATFDELVANIRADILGLQARLNDADARVVEAMRLASESDQRASAAVQAAETANAIAEAAQAQAAEVRAELDRQIGKLQELDDLTPNASGSTEGVVG